MKKIIGALMLLTLISCSSTKNDIDYSVKSKEAIATQENPENELQKDITMYQPKLVDLDGKSVDFGNFRGKNLYVKVMATWCSHCLNNMVETEKAYEDKSRDYNMIIVVSPQIEKVYENNGHTTLEALKSWYNNDEKNKNSIPLLIDPTGEYINYLGVQSIPFNVFYNKYGIQVGTNDGEMSFSDIKKTMGEIK